MKDRVFKASLNFIVRSCLKNPNKQTNPDKSPLYFWIQHYVINISTSINQNLVIRLSFSFREASCVHCSTLGEGQGPRDSNGLIM